MILFPVPNANLGQLFGAYVGIPYDGLLTGSTLTINPTPVTVPRWGAFKRVWVNYMIRGLSYIYWELERGFSDAGPYSFQLQGSQSGTPRADDWFNIGTPTASFYAIDDGGSVHRRMFGKTPTLVYRILLTTPRGLYVSNIANVLGLLNKHDWLIVREILRKEQLNHRIFSSVKGYLLKGRRFGQECSCRDRSVDGQFTDEVTNSSCPICYGTGFANGYYPATEYYGLLDPETTRESRDLQQVGTNKPVVVQGRFLATLPILQGDAWVNGGSDERYYVHTVKELAVWKSVPIIYGVELRLAPFTDALYEVPLH